MRRTRGGFLLQPRINEIEWLEIILYIYGGARSTMINCMVRAITVLGTGPRLDELHTHVITGRHLSHDKGLVVLGARPADKAFSP